VNLTELKTVLDSTGFPVAYSHFVETENEPLPETPFITYLVAFSSHLMADNKTYKKVETVQIELYTDKKNEQAEEVLETVLNNNDLPYSTTETFIDSEQIYQKIYEVRLL
jgi:hypothetical protein